MAPARLLKEKTTTQQNAGTLEYDTKVQVSRNHPHNHDPIEIIYPCVSLQTHLLHQIQHYGLPNNLKKGTLTKFMFVMQMLRAFHQAHNNLRSLLAKAHKSFPPMASTNMVFTHLNVADPLLHSNRLFADRLFLLTSFLTDFLTKDSFLQF